ncbi:Pentatricopeptide repeat-containing protein, chloroplastic [Sesamum alatum]|uniref:Pentatricopeptide repeat-containing protein, chloroplastic n=1 Tax=Sesamum alatum TaxID=300844 RepID=A0AAE1XLG4_9LAMI|nr:Pentatricopeptide repeat-containing protein, chloroplastic [Sesamum alatum]
MIGKNPTGFRLNSVLQMYCGCGSLNDARKLFDEMSQRTLASWVIIISAYADGGLLEDALEFFLRLQDSGLKVNPSIYISLLKSFSNSSRLEIGKQMHCQVIKVGYTKIVAMDTLICNMHVKCGHLESAKLGFDLMQEKNVVAWTIIMVGCIQAHGHEDTLRYFIKMVDEDVDLDEFVFSITLKACVVLDDRKTGEQSSWFDC